MNIIFDIILLVVVLADAYLNRKAVQSNNQLMHALEEFRKSKDEYMKEINRNSIITATLVKLLKTGREEVS